MACSHQFTILGGQLRDALIACVFLACSLVLAQDNGPRARGEIKRWQFSIQNHGVDMQLSASVKEPAGSVLTIRPESNANVKSVEEVQSLRQVLSEMSALGYPSQKLGMISTGLQNSEYREGVEEVVLKSGTWKDCTRTKYCHEAEGVADQFLQSVGAFKEYDGVLHEYGLKRKNIHVGDMGVGTTAGRVQCSGVIVISLEKEK